MRQEAEMVAEGLAEAEMVAGGLAGAEMAAGGLAGAEMAGWVVGSEGGSEAEEGAGLEVVAMAR